MGALMTGFAAVSFMNAIATACHMILRINNIDLTVRINELKSSK